MAKLGFELIFRFLWGALIVLSTISRTETSERFTRIASYIVLGTATFAAYLAYGSGDLRNTYLLCLGVLVVGSFLYSFTSARMTRILGFLCFSLAPLPFWVRQDIGGIVNFVSSGLLFGSVFAGQYLGHWYLTVANLNIKELQRVVKILIAALIFKTLELSVTLYLVTQRALPSYGVDEMGRPLSVPTYNSQALSNLNPVNSMMGVRGTVFLGLGFFGVMILLTRVLWGIIAPYILSYMIKKTVDMRSTQSATGILYALCVMVILGEGAALFLKHALGWNL